MKKYSVLCVDDESTLLSVLVIILEKSGFTVFSATNGFDALEIAAREEIDIAVIDYKMPGMDGIELLKKIKEVKPKIEILMLTGHGTIPNAVEAIKIGAFDFILKPFHKNDLLNRIEKLLEFKNLKDENTQLKNTLKQKYQFTNLIGKTPQMTEILNIISKVSEGDSNVLILGETGTGKGEIAKAIHYSGPNAEKIFTVVDCTSINPNLIESELFGHIKGSFTGAVSDKEGLLSASGDSTIFLDEIAEIPVYIQVKLLRAIEERMIRPVGSTKSVSFNARIIAATSRDIRKAIKDQEFREDLYFRLNVVSIKIPPLRERKDDIPLLVNHFIKKFDNGRDHIKGVSDKALRFMTEYSWPGNVRELENCIERSFALGAKGEIDTQDLPDSLLHEQHIPAEASEKGYVSIPDQEKHLIIETLGELRGNKRETAKRLKIGVTTLYRKLEKYGIK